MGMKIIVSIIIAVLTLSGGSYETGEISQWSNPNATIYQNNCIDYKTEINISEFEVLWSKKTVSEKQNRLVSNIVSDGANIFFNQHGNIYCVNISSGESEWVASYGKPNYDHSIRFPKMFCYDEAIFYIDGYNDLYKISKEDGSLIWSVLCEDFDNLYNFGTLAVYENYVICNVDYGMICIDNDSGKIKWRNTKTGSSYGIPVIYENKVIFAGLFFLDWLSLSSGKILESYDLDNDPSFTNISKSQPRIGISEVIIDDRCGFQIYDASKMKHINSVVIVEECDFYGRVHVATNGEHNVFFNPLLACYSNDGEVLWSFASEKEYKTLPWTNPIIIDESVYILKSKLIDYNLGTYKHKLYKINLQTGNWSEKILFQEDIGSVSSVIFSSGKFFVVVDNTIYCIGEPK